MRTLKQMARLLLFVGLATMAFTSCGSSNDVSDLMGEPEAAIDVVYATEAIPAGTPVEEAIESGALAVGIIGEPNFPEDAVAADLDLLTGSSTSDIKKGSTIVDGMFE